MCEAISNAYRLEPESPAITRDQERRGSKGNNTVIIESFKELFCSLDIVSL